IFTGQGNEYVKMGEDLFNNSSESKEMIESLKLNFNFNDICVKENALVSDTRYSQTSVFLISIALAKLLNKYGVYADATAGLSLGEYTSLCYSDAISIQDTVDILYQRSNIMYNALKNSNSGMVAVLLSSKKPVEIDTNEFNCEVANYNSPQQIVLTGDNLAIESCSKKYLEEGALKAIKLNVTGAFHSVFLKDGSGTLGNYLSNYKFEVPKIPVYYNYVGNKGDYNINELLVKQLYNPVLFKQSIERMIEDGIEQFCCIGVGSSPASFIKAIAKSMDTKVDIQVFEKVSDVEKFAKSFEPSKIKKLLMKKNKPIIIPTME
ncbi:MAG: ACP S-malonyltransferase, partial [Bacilli bacterium]|nr:ACP S-malonyltransferase [Bacilli bacterium]